MTVKIKVVRASLLEHPVRNIILIALVGTLILGLVVCESIFGYYYFTYRHKVDEWLQKPLFQQTAMIYAAPKEVRVGQKLTPQTIAQELRAAGYSGEAIRCFFFFSGNCLRVSFCPMRKLPWGRHISWLFGQRAAFVAFHPRCAGI